MAEIFHKPIEVPHEATFFNHNLRLEIQTGASS